ncbi:pyruvate, phosphate dikinase [Taibaiella sp. KBW10]|uniref:PEP/pyruvate-binding domain-containing protein n=1 Tax=Taibaiella sp. KBW10 TaxID=2153357 RepID=UPI000F59712D|nr:PEP/pyruvate-binding domain-containing protein [Taibaiella sp. KBW10]RQO32349.1 pyruvate, phosphate dikinase [Taibaiella sp. KBW10]
MSRIFLLCCILFHFSLSAQKHYVKTLSNKEEFINLSGRPLSDKFTNMKSVKVVFDCFDSTLYFFNSTKYKYHHEFCEKVLRYPPDLGSFNAASYNAGNSRSFLLGNLNYLAQTEDWVLELAPSDLMNASLINLFYKKIKKQVFFGDKLKFYLNTPRTIALAAENKLQVPFVYSDFLFRNLTEQSIEKGTAYGLLKKYDIKKEPRIYPKPNEIIIINTTPEIIPNVKGIIITELQTPLSHLVLLAKNRNIPVYVDTKIWDKEATNALLNQPVALTVTEDAYRIEATTKNIDLTTSKPPIKLVLNLDTKGLVDLAQPLPDHPQNIIGSKALNLALLKKIEKTTKGFKTPEYAYAIPFYYYTQHLKNNKLEAPVADLLATPKDSVLLLYRKLKALRKQIKQAPIDKALIQLVQETLSTQSQFKQFKFRSSTNAEDLDGFNGAGLYDSKSATLGDSEKTIEKAILAVWASFWNDRAFFEREIFHIDHQSCAMGILIHRSFPDELANGVLITKNIYRSEYEGITVNVQKGEASVVEPDSGVTCDEFYCHNFNFLSNDLSVDYRSTSSLNEHQPILSNAEIKLLFDISTKVENRMHRLWRQYQISGRNMSLDIEFKLVGTKRHLYLKQARAYMD